MYKRYANRRLKAFHEEHACAQQALDRLQEEQRRIDSVAATKEQTLALQEMLGEVAHFLALRALCSVACAALLYVELGARRGGDAVSWAAVLAPLVVSSGVQCARSARLMRRKAREPGTRAADHEKPSARIVRPTTPSLRPKTHATCAEIAPTCAPR